MDRNLETFAIPKPFRGFNDTDDEMMLPPNMLVQAENVVFDRGGVRTRDGYSTYSVSGLTIGEIISGLFVFRKSDGNQWLLLAQDSNLFKEGVIGVFSSIKASLTGGGLWNFTSLVDIAIMSDGVNKPQKFDGTICKDLEVVAPTIAPSVALGIAGAMTGDYQYRITFLSAKGAETNGGPTSAIIVTTSDKVDLSNIELGGLDVIKRKIYRTTAGGSVFYLLVTINDNTTTIYTDNTIDSALGTDLCPETHDTPPTDGKFPTVYKEFLFMIDPTYPTRVYFSHQSLPEIFYTAEGTGYYLIVGLNDGQDVIGMRAMRDMIYIFKDYSTFPISGSSPDDFRATVQPVSGSKGLFHRSIANIDLGSGDILVGLTRDGLYAFDGYSYKNIGVQPESGINISTFFSGLDQAQLHRATGWNDVENKRYICYVRESGSAYNNKAIVWDYHYNSISIDTVLGNAIAYWSNNIFFGGNDGILYNVGGLNDNGSAIPVEIE